MSYPTFEQLDREAAESRRQCKHAGSFCDAPLDSTKPCESCGVSRCPAHLYNGDCANCFKLNDAADALNERRAA